jgi:hypothetical protein
MTLFDVVTLACFVAMAGAFFWFAAGDVRKLPQLILSGIVFGVANQLGNADYVLLASILIVAGAGYALFVMRG